MVGDVDNLCEAIKSADLATVDALILAGTDVNTVGATGWSPLRLAIERATPEIVNQLIAHGADVNAVDDQGWTPLMHAIDFESDVAWQVNYKVGCESTELTGLLLAAGARPTNGALELATEYQNQKAVILLNQYVKSA